MEQLSSSDTKETAKPGPKPKVSQKEFEALQDKVERLTKALEHIATNSGQGNLLRQYGMERYEPSTKDMSRWAN